MEQRFEHSFTFCSLAFLNGKNIVFLRSPRCDPLQWMTVTRCAPGSLVMKIIDHFSQDAQWLSTFTHGVKTRIYSSHTFGVVGAQELQRVMLERHALHPTP